MFYARLNPDRFLPTLSQHCFHRPMRRSPREQCYLTYPRYLRLQTVRAQQPMQLQIVGSRSLPDPDVGNSLDACHTTCRGDC